jgi:hypothetical protein
MVRILGAAISCPKEPRLLIPCPETRQRRSRHNRDGVDLFYRAARGQPYGQ